IRFHKDFQSKFLGTHRDITVYVPPGYNANPTRRYPVLYLQDGQNMFDAATSFLRGQEWHLDEQEQLLVAQHAVDPMIIVGISSSGLARVNEFTPSSASRYGGQADLYGRMLVEEIKPFIDARYRTTKERSHTALGGTSLGGLATLYLGLKYKDIFGQLAILSPAAFWDHEMIVRYVQSLPAKTNQRIFLAIGTAELKEFLGSTRELHQALLEKGWKDGSDLGYFEGQGLQHGPGVQAFRVKRMLQFISPVSDSEKSKQSAQH